MHSRHNRIFTFALALLLLASVLLPGLAQEAQALHYDGSSSYESGKYYRALTQVQLTGDGRTDIVNVAKSQVGYQEGGSQNQLSGEVYGGVSYTEYGRWYGLQDMWCAMFASWCANVAGISTSVIPSHSYTPSGLQWFRDRNRAFSREQVADGLYTPQPGDLIYFKSPRNTNPTNHVGIVTGYSNGTVYTIEGNVGGMGSHTNGGTVAQFSYPISNTYIVYICSPGYTAGSTGVNVWNTRMEALRSAVYSVETGGEADYDRITEAYSDGINGRAITIGSGQWYGTAARELLMQIRSADEAAFDRLDTAGIAADLEQQDWSCYQISADSEKAQAIRAILSSDAGIAVQDKRMDAQLEAYLQEAKELGATDPAARMLCAGLYHLAGVPMTNRLLKQIDGDLSAENIYAALNGSGFESLRIGGSMIYDAVMECF